MSEETEQLLDKIDSLRKKLQKKDVRGGAQAKTVAGFISTIQKMFDNMDPDDKKTVRNRFNTNMSRFRQRRKALGNAQSKAFPRAKRKKDGPDLTNRASGGVIRRRGGGIAKRGMGIAK